MICQSMREDICKHCGRRIHDGIRTNERFLFVEIASEST